VRVEKFTALEPAFDVQPHHTWMMRTQARAFESVGLINGAVTVKQNGECAADFIHPLLEGGKRSKGDDKDARIELFEFILARAQLCGMFAAGYSAKVTKEDEQGISVFEDFAECDLFTINGLQGEVGSGGEKFHGNW